MRTTVIPHTTIPQVSGFYVARHINDKDGMSALWLPMCVQVSPWNRNDLIIMDADGVCHKLSEFEFAERLVISQAE